MDAHPNDKPEHLVFSCERKTAPEGDVPKEIVSNVLFQFQVSTHVALS